MFQMVQSQLSDLELIVKTTLAEHILMEFTIFFVNLVYFSVLFGASTKSPF